MNNCVVYEHENLVNGKRYFGITIKKPTDRWGKDGSGYDYNEHFWRAIQKYGWNEGFSHKILFEGLSVAEACEIEEMLIADYKTQDPQYGYNLTSGGEHFSHGEETRRKISEANKGKTLSEETRRKISESKMGENNPWYGKHHGEETRRKISEANKGENNPMYGRTGENHPWYGKHHGEETRRKISESKMGENNPWWGKTHSEETRRKLSEALKGREVSEETRRKLSENNAARRPEVRRKISESLKGENNPWYGKHHSEETRRKMSESHCRPVEAIDPETDLRVHYFGSIMDAGRAGFISSNIVRCCKGKSKTHKGLIWRYVENESN